MGTKINFYIHNSMDICLNDNEIEKSKLKMSKK